ncbi:MAG TPA: aminoglycoside phosphotransferase family protein [Actinomycetota bacterium]|jgi:aminoglycoside phosphotransferase (APT) family kinase protein|nr:aminoglycoside phosphotransferase family protein [Actinomycetota bacterium]
MQHDEVDIDTGLVSRLLRRQFPEWADLPLTPVEPAGTDNAIYRLGHSMSVRLPRIGWASDQPLKEHTLLPQLEPHLSLAVPTPLALGEPAEGYPWNWSVCSWLDGETAAADRLGDPETTARDLVRFVHELQAIDATDGPTPKGRGGPLAERDEACRRSIAKLADSFDAPKLEDEWGDALAAPVWSDPPVWLHGDLDARNLLATDGRLSGVLDWASAGVGDPAAEVMVAWKMFEPVGRERFLAELDVDEATWQRARGWVLSQAVMILSYYTFETNAVLLLEAERWLSELFADVS